MDTEDKGSVLIRGALSECARMGAYRDMLAALQDRPECDAWGTLRTRLAAAGAAPDTAIAFTRHVKQGLGSINPSFTDTFDEIVIGLGYHAWLYAAARISAGYPAPLMIGREPGGIMAVSEWPAWWLNSENIPGKGGRPVEYDGALNYLPYGPVQPADYEGRETGTNAGMAFAILASAAQHASDVIIGNVTRVENLSSSDRYATVTCLKGNSAFPVKLYAKRVIDARGCGDPRDDAGAPDGQVIMSFSQFMARAGNAWPLRGITKLAVIGSGDAGKCSVEMGLGISPAHRHGSATLDYVPKVDWYAPGKPQTSGDGRLGEQGRYARLWSFAPRTTQGRDRLAVLPYKATATRAGDVAYVNGIAYSHVVLANGYNTPAIDPGGQASNYRVMEDPVTGQVIARTNGSRVYAIGPVADLPFSSSERDAGISRIGRNKVAMFRLAPLTIRLAAILGRP